jgi:acetyl esterase/lipase
MTTANDVLTRPAPEPDFELRYGPGPDHLIDVHLPSGPAAPTDPLPLVVVIHGGFWRAAFDRRHARPQAAGLTRAGYAVASLEYRRTGGGGGWPATFDDVAAALDALPALLAAAAPGRVDTSRPVLVGHSAGGHLALWAAARHRLPAGSPWRLSERPDLGGVVGLAGVSDLSACATDALGEEAAIALVGGTPAQEPGRYAQADPTLLLPAGVPAILVHGTADDRVPVEMSRQYARAAAASGEPVGLVELPGVDHFALIDPQTPAWQPVLDAVAALIQGRARG